MGPLYTKYIIFKTLFTANLLASTKKITSM